AARAGLGDEGAVLCPRLDHAFEKVGRNDGLVPAADHLRLCAARAVLHDPEPVAAAALAVVLHDRGEEVRPPLGPRLAPLADPRLVAPALLAGAADAGILARLGDGQGVERADLHRAFV